MRTIFRFILRHLSLNRAIGYLLATRVWQSASYLVLAFLISRYFTIQEQGYYYTFLSLLALQVFVELGLAFVIISAASHEWASLSVDETLRITGNREALSRLVSLGRIVFKWYAIAMAFFIVGAGLAGWILFQRGRPSGVAWEGPWFALVILAGAALCVTPFNALLEGCNQVTNINRAKFQQVVLESVALWVGLIFGLGLWCLPLSIGVRLTRNLGLVTFQYRNFFRPFLHAPESSRIDWNAELWPMQWRLAIQSLVVFCSNSLFNPVMFHYHGAAVAGRTGMTLQMITGMQIISMAWITTKVPTFGALIARGHFAELDILWVRSTITSLAVLLASLLCFNAVLFVARNWSLPLTQRLLDSSVVVIFSAATLMVQLAQCFAAYLRAHRKEPIMIASISSSVMTGLLVWLLGKRWGPLGAGVGYLIPSLISVCWFWFIWKRCCREWHVPQP